MKLLLLSLVTVGLFAQPCLQQGSISSVSATSGLDNTSTLCTTWTMIIQTVGPVARYSASLQGDFGSGFVDMSAPGNPCTTVTRCTVTYVGLAPNTVRINVTSFVSVPVGGSLAYGLSGSPPITPTQNSFIINGTVCTLGSSCSISTTPSGAAGGDLSGTYPNPGVAKLNGVAPPLPNTSLLNSSTTVNGVTCTLGSSCTVATAPTGAAGGDLSGTYPNPGVSKVNGNTPGNTCTNQFTRNIDSSARGTCATVQNADLSSATVTVNGTSCTLGSSCSISTGGALAQIQKQTAVGATASFTFSAIAGTFTDLILSIVSRGDTAAQLVTVTIQFNADTGTNYDNELFQTSGNFSNIGTAQPAVCQSPAASNTANMAGTCEIIIHGYSNTTFNHNFMSAYSFRTASGSAAITTGTSGNDWLNTAAITSIKVFPISGNFVSGTVATLWGRT